MTRDDADGRTEGRRAVDAVVITGTVGAGKTTALHALGRLLGGLAVPHALVDVDQVRLLDPAPPGDPFAEEVALRNLHAVSRNYRAAGARLVIAAGVIERATDVPRYMDALAATDPLLVRLETTARALEERLHGRHADDPDGRAWHLARAPELAAIIARADLGGLVVDTTDRTPEEVAALIAERAGLARSRP